MHRKHHETMHSSNKELHHSSSVAHQRCQSQTERREKRLKMQGMLADKPLLDGKAARDEIKELNFRQENRLVALKESLK